MKVCFWDLKVGDTIRATGKAQNAYIITSKSQKTIGLKRKSDGLEYQMDTGRALDMINQYSNPAPVPTVVDEKKKGRPKKYSILKAGA